MLVQTHNVDWDGATTLMFSQQNSNNAKKLAATNLQASQIPGAAWTNTLSTNFSLGYFFLI